MQVRLFVYQCFLFDANATRNFKAKGQLTKANQTKTKMENLARELQKVRLCQPRLGCTFANTVF